MIRIFLYLTVFYLPIYGDDPKDISNVLRSHLRTQVPRLSSLASVGNLNIRDVIMHDAQLGDMTTLRLIGRAWFWRKFIWFSVFGDLQLDSMYLTAKSFTINGQNHTGKINIGDNTLRFYWEGVDHFKCTILKERIDWLPLRKFSLHEGKTTRELIFSDDEVFNLKKSLLSEDFVNRITDVLLPCLHPKYPISYGWESEED